MPNKYSHMSLSERFEQKVQYEANTGCWLWSGAMERHGYGLIIAETRQNPRLAHRVSYELHRGEIPHGLCVCHRCDTPACVNPDHLWLGTQRANIQDASRKRRMPLGERQGNSKLKNAEVISIRALAAEGRNQYEIAALFGISQPTVSEIVARKKWPHI